MTDIPLRPLLLIAVCLLPVPLAADPPNPQDAGAGGDRVAPAAIDGARIYADRCAECHGDHGQGNVNHFGQSLAGDLSIRELADVIAATMPEEDPESCVGEHAVAVATYIHGAFYSPAAQARRQPPRARLARLTGEQLRQSVADLYGHFQADPWTTPQRGIEGAYYTGAGAADDRIRMRRIDSAVDFDFGNHGPGDEVDPQEFFIRWTGSLWVPSSGSYEIIVRSSCSFTMEFGRSGRLLIDNHVQSAGKDEFRRSLQLTGGRVYPLKIDLQQRKRKTEQPPVRIALSWVPPGGGEEVIPTQYLIPETFPPVYALAARLPPDDSSYGYPRGISIDRAWDQSVTDAAIEFSQVVIDELFPAYLAGADADRSRRQRLQEFLRQMIEVAFRGAVDDEIAAMYVDLPLQQSPADDLEAIRRVVMKCFKSPRFLYPTLDQQASKSRRAANRLAWVLFDSLPSDKWLVDAAARHVVLQPEQIQAVAERMVRDYRARAKIRQFLYHWLDLNNLGELTKDEQLFPGFDQRLVNDLKHSFDQFVDTILFSDASDFRQLLQADWALTNDRIADFYGPHWGRAAGKASPALADPDLDGGWAATGHDARRHVGVLTHPLLTSHLAYHATSSPIHRGVFLSRKVLGRVIRPPDEAFTPLDAALHPDLTTRQRVQLQTGEKNCQVCHQKINSLGFALENYDAVGRYRQQERQQPIDASGGYQPRQGDPVRFDGARQLGDYLAASEDCQRAFVDAAFEYLVKQPPAAFGAETSDLLLKSFRDSGYHMIQLFARIASLVGETATQPAGT